MLQRQQYLSKDMQHLNMKSEADRRLMFEKWLVAFIDMDNLAEAGFNLLPSLWVEHIRLRRSAVSVFTFYIIADLRLYVTHETVFDKDEKSESFSALYSKIWKC